jgi:hypothetical protein
VPLAGARRSIVGVSSTRYDRAKGVVVAMVLGSRAPVSASRLWLSLAMVSVPALVASSGCSASNSSSLDGGAASGHFTGLTGCDAGSPTVTTECALSVPLTGAISGTFSDFSSCGSSSLSLSWGNLGGPSGLGLSVTFMGAAFPVDQLGTFPLRSLDVTQAADGGPLRWTVPPAGCSVTIQGSICSPTTVFQTRRVLSGTGTCTQPAAPQAGNTGAPVTIGDFTFIGFINPP